MEINLLQEEIDRLKKVKESSEKLTAEIGSLAIQKARLEILEQSLKDDLKDVMIEETSISQELLGKYGPVSIDIEKGIAITLEQ